MVPNRHNFSGCHAVSEQSCKENRFTPGNIAVQESRFKNIIQEGDCFVLSLSPWFLLISVFSSCNSKTCVYINW